METTVLSAEEAAEYVEFKRTRREAEIALTLKKMIADASRRETDKYTLKKTCDTVRKLSLSGVLVSPVNVAHAARLLAGTGARVVCIVGGTGESLPAVKRTEAKKAVSMGAGEIRLVLCYSALTGGNYTYLKREIKKIRRAVRRVPLVVSLEDHSIGEEEVALGVRAACEGGASGVCVRGETGLLLRACSVGTGRLLVDCSGVENAEQLHTLLRAGAARATSGDADRIAEEMYEAARLAAERTERREERREERADGEADGETGV